jgi:hypothetical protein
MRFTMEELNKKDTGERGADAAAEANMTQRKTKR